MHEKSYNITIKGHMLIDAVGYNSVFRIIALCGNVVIPHRQVME